MKDLQLAEQEIRSQIEISFPNLSRAARLDLMAIWFQQWALCMRFGLLARAANISGLDGVEKETREGERRFVAMVTKFKTDWWDALTDAEKTRLEADYFSPFPKGL
jgi:hypothetical protein